MGKSGPSQPDPPDPYETAAADAQFNNMDTYGPAGGGVRFGYTNDAGQFVQGVAPEGYQSAQMYVENPTEQRIREELQPAAINTVGHILGDYEGGLPDRAQVRDRGEVANSIFNRTMSMLRPEIEQSNDRLLTNLQARGMPVGSEAFNDAYGAQQRETQDTMSRLAMDADIAAGGEQSRLYGLESAERQGAMSELAALMSGNYTPPTNIPSGQSHSVNYSGLVSENYQNELAQYEAAQERRMSTASTIGSLGAGLIMKSTMESKDFKGPLNAQWAAATLAVMPLGVWSYKPGEEPANDAPGSEHIGPMAEHFHAMTGLSSDKEISIIDYCGLLAGALQHALAEIEMLKRDMYDQRVS